VTETNEQHISQTPAKNDESYVLAVYILYLSSYFFLITGLIGIIIAYVKRPTATGIMENHFQFQIRTFLIGLIYYIPGALLLFLYIGFPILLWWFVWTLVRTIKGLILLNDGQPVPNPTSWLFG